MLKVGDKIKLDGSYKVIYSVEENRFGYKLWIVNFKPIRKNYDIPMDINISLKYLRKLKLDAIDGKQ